MISADEARKARENAITELQNNFFKSLIEDIERSAKAGWDFTNIKTGRIEFTVDQIISLQKQGFIVTKNNNSDYNIEYKVEWRN